MTDWIERYAAAVGKRLPYKMRAEIEAELRSTLQDMVEDRSRESGQPVTDELIKEVLKAYGDPHKVAAGYAAPPVLIGPELYPTFVLVFKIVLAVLAVVAGIEWGLGLAQSDGADFWPRLGRLLLDLVSGFMAAFGNIVLIFAILERTLPVTELMDEEGSWNPAELAEQGSPNQVSVGELAFETVFVGVGLGVLNLYPQALSLRLMQGGERVTLPILSSAFFEYLPWINLVGLLTIGLNILLIREGSWRRLTRWLQIGLEGLGMGVAVAMLSGPALIGLTATQLSGQALGEASEILARLAEWMPRLTLALVIGLSLVEIGKQIVRLTDRSEARLPFLKSE